MRLVIILGYQVVFLALNGGGKLAAVTFKYELP
jgi:hypothetical protein